MSKSPETEEAPAAGISGGDDYVVGYGKPPKHGQFKPGNKLAKGRPKAARNLKTIVRAAMGQKVSVKIGGKTKKLSKVELIVHQVATKASQGDFKAAQKALMLYERYGPQDDQDGPEPEKVARDLDALRGHLAMMDQIFPPGDDEENEDG